MHIIFTMYDPVIQFVQVLCPVVLPVAQNEHTVSPGEDPYVPSSHEIQEVSAVKFPYFPAAQLEQTLEPTTLANVLTGQSLHKLKPEPVP